MKKIAVFFAALLCMFASSPLSLMQQASAADLAPVAMTTDVQGAAWQLEGNKRTKLGLLAYLTPGLKLQLEPGARVSVTYFAMSREFVLNGPMQAVIEAEQVHAVSGAAPLVRSLERNQVIAGQKLTARQRERQSVATFEMKAFVPGNLQLRSPVDTRLIAAPTEFIWRPVPGASTYQFLLADTQGRPIHRVSSEARSLRLPDEVKLQPGQAYSWTVEVQGSSGLTQTASAGFSLLDEATAQKFISQRPAAGASFSERLLYASLLENAGLKLDAQIYWKALAAERPNDETLQELSNR